MLGTQGRAHPDFRVGSLRFTYLTTNTCGKPAVIFGSDQFTNYFDFAMSSSGTAIAFWSIAGNGSNTTWRAATRSGSGVPWNAPATAGTSFDGGGVPEGVAVNAAGQAAVVFTDTVRIS